MAFLFYFLKYFISINLVIISFIIILSIISLIAKMSNLTIEIKNMKIAIKENDLTRNEKEIKEKLEKNYIVIFKYNIFKKIPILKYELTDKKIKKITEKKKFKKRMEKIEKKINDNKENITKNLKEIKKDIKLDIEKMNINLKIGTDNSSLTAILVGVINIIFSILYIIFLEEKENNSFKIEPVYTNKYVLKIEIESIIRINLIHIINIIYILKRRKGEDINERPSNRRTYGYSHE